VKVSPIPGIRALFDIAEDAEEQSHWKRVTAYAESPLLSFSGARDPGWTDAGAGVYCESGDCRICGASVDVRGAEPVREPPNQRAYCRSSALKK
jgi:hypothetical protein